MCVVCSCYFSPLSTSFVFIVKRHSFLMRWPMRQYAAIVWSGLKERARGYEHRSVSQLCAVSPNQACAVPWSTCTLHVCTKCEVISLFFFQFCNRIFTMIKCEAIPNLSWQTGTLNCEAVKLSSQKWIRLSKSSQSYFSFKTPFSHGFQWLLHARDAWRTGLESSTGCSLWESFFQQRCLSCKTTLI